jgi:hypothetical protein
MKKLFALSIVLLLVAGAAFAQIPDGFKVGAWGRAVFLPIQGTFTDSDPAVNKAWSGVGSGWGPARVGIDLNYVSEIAGARLHLIGDGTTSGGDNIDIWVKPFKSDILKIDVGKFRDGTLRGPGTDGDSQLYVGGPGADGDAVFNRFEPDGGALFFSKPIPALSLFLQLNPGWATFTGLTADSRVDAADVWKKLQAGLGYEIEGVGLARAQYVGGTGKVTPGSAAKFEWDPDTYDGTVPTIPPTGTASVPGWKYVKAGEPSVSYSRIEAAFKLTMVQGLTADLGLKLPLPVTDDDTDTTYSDNVQVNLAGSFAAGDFGVTYGLYSGFGGSVKPDSGDASNLPLTLNIVLTPSYYLAALDAKVGGDLGFKLKGNSTTAGTDNKDGSTIIGFGAWVERGIGKGTIKVGAAYQLPENKNDGGTENQTGVFSLPIILHIGY